MLCNGKVGGIRGASVYPRKTPRERQKKGPMGGHGEYCAKPQGELSNMVLSSKTKNNVSSEKKSSSSSGNRAPRRKNNPPVAPPGNGQSGERVGLYTEAKGLRPKKPVARPIMCGLVVRKKERVYC